MECPKCKGNPLVARKVKAGRIELDHCQQCGGLWFDSAELDQILGSKASARYAIPTFAFENKGCQCPRCHTSLYEFCYPGTMTLIDACKSCHGIWLDNNEWKEIAKARESRQVTVCPACNTRQLKTASCQSCGIVFTKIEEGINSTTDQNQLHQQSERMENSNAAKNFVQEDHPYSNDELDNIPGVKGKLLRFIDRSIDTLTRY